MRGVLIHILCCRCYRCKQVATIPMPHTVVSSCLSVSELARDSGLGRDRGQVTDMLEQMKGRICSSRI